MASEISFDRTPDEGLLIEEIAERAQSLGISWDDDLEATMMDVTATHANGCPLDLAKLLSFDDFNFIHDVGGIYNFLNRHTGKLEKHFLPRCALPENHHEKATT